MLPRLSQPARTGSTRPSPAERVEHWPLDRFAPYAANARLHSAADLDKIAASIRKWGWTIPVLADEEGVLLAGHARIGAAAKLGLTSIPVIVARAGARRRSAAIAWPTTNWRRGRAGTPSNSARNWVN